MKARLFVAALSCLLATPISVQAAQAPAGGGGDPVGVKLEEQCRKELNRNAEKGCAEAVKNLQDAAKLSCEADNAKKPDECKDRRATAYMEELLKKKPSTHSDLITAARTIATSETEKAAARKKSGSSNVGRIGSASTLGLPNLTFAGVAQSLLNLLTFLAGILATVFLIFGGFKYVYADGNPQNLTSAKQTIQYAIVGIVVALVSQGIVAFVLNRAPQ